MQIKESSDEETAVPAVCCGHGFLKDDIQQKEDDCQKKLVLIGKKSLSYEVKWLSLEAALYSTRFMPRTEQGTGYESALLSLEKRVLKSSQDVEIVPVDVPRVTGGLATREVERRR